ncbi:hypothetical protein Sjap_020176 [Stephania japonica]|uniref:Quinone oxidoreductase n=1 Tax=Stephania japonica TaxID=461633 RepID=A0AAP0F2Z9_9MAGN
MSLLRNRIGRQTIRLRTHQHLLALVPHPKFTLRLPRTGKCMINLSINCTSANNSEAVRSVAMVKAIRVHELGGPEVLKWEDVEVEEPKEGEIRVKNKAIGLNFIDVYFRKGVYKSTTMPFIPDKEERLKEGKAISQALRINQWLDLLSDRPPDLLLFICALNELPNCPERLVYSPESEQLLSVSHLNLE